VNVRGRTGRRRTLRALALAAALALTGCGVQATDVIEAGGPATVFIIPGEGNWMLLFFVTPDGELIPVTRPITDDNWRAPSGMTRDRALQELFHGLTEDERAAGLRTGLPKLSPKAHKMGVGGDPERNALMVHLPLRIDDLDDRAVEQVVCTVAYAGSPSGTRPVALWGTDAMTEPTTCRADINRDDVPRPAASALPQGTPTDPPAPSGTPWDRTSTEPPPTSGAEPPPTGP
jgi:hypothetical protein